MFCCQFFNLPCQLYVLLGLCTEFLCFNVKNTFDVVLLAFAGIFHRLNGFGKLAVHRGGAAGRAGLVVWVQVSSYWLPRGAPLLAATACSRGLALRGFRLRREAFARAPMSSEAATWAPLVVDTADRHFGALKTDKTSRSRRASLPSWRSP